MKIQKTIICFCGIMCLLGCKNGKGIYRNNIITIVGDEKTIIDGKSFFTKIDTVLLRPKIY